MIMQEALSWLLILQKQQCLPDDNSRKTFFNKEISVFAITGPLPDLSP